MASSPTRGAPNALPTRPQGAELEASSVRREGETENELSLFSAARLKIPGETAHKEARIARYEMDIVDAAGFIAQS